MEVVAEELDIKKLLGKLLTSNSGELNPDLLKRLKSICKKDDENVRITSEVLFSFLKKAHSVIRLNCVHLADILFSRSNCYRILMLEKFELFTSLTLASDPSKPLPPPESQHKKLRSEAIRMIKEWHSKFGPAYKKLENSFSVLKEIVDFDNLCMNDDEDRRRKREREAKLESIWRNRIEKIGSEFQEIESDIEVWMTTTTNLLSLASSNEKLYQEELIGHYSILTKRWLPTIQSWVDTLTKAGNRTDHQLLAKCVDHKNKLTQEKIKFDKLNIVTENSAPIPTSSDCSSSKPQSSLESDPTSWYATIKKVTGNADVSLNMGLSDRSSSSTSSNSEPQPSTSKDSSCDDDSKSIPRVRLEDLKEPDRMTVDPDKSRFWVSDHREGKQLVVGTTQKISEFIGDWEPGKSTSVSSASANPHKKKKVIRKTNRVKAADKYDESSRSRISKKIFSKSSARRVAKDQKRYDKIRTKDKFVDQFNY